MVSYSRLYQEFFERDVDLRLNNQLRDLAIETITAEKWGPSADAHFLADILDQASSPALEKVFVGLSVSRIQNLDSFDWSRVDHIFSRSRAPNMREIRIGIQSHGVKKTDLISSLQQRLPDCHAQKILFF